MSEKPSCPHCGTVVEFVNPEDLTEDFKRFRCRGCTREFSTDPLTAKDEAIALLEADKYRLITVLKVLLRKTGNRVSFTADELLDAADDGRAVFFEQDAIELRECEEIWQWAERTLKFPEW